MVSMRRLLWDWRLPPSGLALSSRISSHIGFTGRRVRVEKGKTKNPMNLRPQDPSPRDRGKQALDARLRRCKRAAAIAGNLFAASFPESARRSQDSPGRRELSGKETDLHRLFRRDQSTRMDFAVHFSLGLAALLAVVFAAGATLDFCAQLDQIAARLSPDHSPTLVSAPGEKGRGSLTNAAGVGVPLPDSGRGPQTNLPAAVPAAWRGVGLPMSG